MRGNEIGSVFLRVFSVIVWINVSAGWSMMGSALLGRPADAKTSVGDRMLTAAGENLLKRKLHSHLTPVPLKKHSLSLPSPSLVQAMESNDPVTVSEFCSSIGAGSFGNPYYHCKIYHVCQKDGRTDTLPCPQGLRFNNIYGLCDWPGKVDKFCSPLVKSSKYDATKMLGEASFKDSKELILARLKSEWDNAELPDTLKTTPNQSMSLEISFVPPAPAEVRTRQDATPNWFLLTVPSEHHQVPYRVLPHFFSNPQHKPFRRLHPRFHMRFDRHPYKERYIPQKNRIQSSRSSDAQDFLINYVRSRAGTEVY